MSITVNVNELHKFVSEMKKDGMDLVELTIIESEGENPSFLSFSCCKKATSFEWIDYEEIDSAI